MGNPFILIPIHVLWFHYFHFVYLTHILFILYVFPYVATGNIWLYICYCFCLVAQSSLTLEIPWIGISQTRILEWVAVSSSSGSSQHRDWTWVSCTADRFFTTEPLGNIFFVYSSFLLTSFCCIIGLPWWLSSKEFACRCRRCCFDAWVGKVPLEKDMAIHSSILV